MVVNSAIMYLTILVNVQYQDRKEVNTITENPTKKKIMDAALIEFAEKGYEHASTNSIVNRAGVGKGMLFYYFKNKEDLYRYLVDEGIKAVRTIFKDDRPFESDDFLERCQELSKLKMNRYVKEPLLFNFFGNSYLNDRDVPELADAIQKELDMSQKMHKTLYSDLDTSKLREDIPPDELIKIIKCTVDGYEQQLTAGLKGKDLTKVDLDPLWDDFDGFIDNLRTIFYK